jgi:hypothetical protein
MSYDENGLDRSGFIQPVPLRLLLIGHSHVQTLRRATLDYPDLFSTSARRPVEIDFLFLPDSGASLSTSRASGGVRPFVENWLEEPKRFREEGTRLFDEMHHIAVLWQGSHLSTQMTFAVGSEFDVVLPGECNGPVPAGAEVIPYAAVEELMRTPLEMDPAFRAAIALLGSPPFEGKVSFLAPPPPLPIEAVRERLTVEPFFTEKAQQLGLDLTAVRLVPDRIRVKVWKILVSVYGALADRYGARLIAPPSEAADEMGLLAPEYWGGDVTHASPAYGRLYLEKILSHITGSVN